MVLRAELRSFGITSSYRIAFRYFLAVVGQGQIEGSRKATCEAAAGYGESNLMG